MVRCGPIDRRALNPNRRQPPTSDVLTYTVAALRMSQKYTAGAPPHPAHTAPSVVMR